jgi:cell division protein FtsA
LHFLDNIYIIQNNLARNDQMSVNRKKEHISAIEIGTKHVKVLIAEILENNKLMIIGYGQSSSLKVEKGEIINPKIVVEQIDVAVFKAENMSNVPITNICLAITGSHIKTTNHQGFSPVNGKTITDEHVIAATRLARSGPISDGYELIHLLERFYSIDGNRRVQNPVGLIASNLISEVHFIYGKSNNINTSKKILDGIFDEPPLAAMFSGLCSAYATMTDSDVEKGALVIDIGAGTTEFALYNNKTIQHSGVITVGTNQICNDLAIGLHLEYNRCQNLLIKYGSAISKNDGRTRAIDVSELAGQKDRKIPRSTFETIIEVRLTELFEIIYNELVKADVKNLMTNGVILCGGGSRIPDIVELAKRVFESPCRIGKIVEIGGDDEVILDPGYATCAGALKIGKDLLAIENEQNKSTMQEVKTEIKKTIHNIKNALKW